MGEGRVRLLKGKIRMLHQIQIGQKHTLPLDCNCPVPTHLFADRRSGTWGCSWVLCFCLWWVWSDGASCGQTHFLQARRPVGRGLVKALPLLWFCRGSLLASVPCFPRHWLRPYSRAKNLLAAPSQPHLHSTARASCCHTLFGGTAPLRRPHRASSCTQYQVASVITDTVLTGPRGQP